MKTGSLIRNFFSRPVKALQAEPAATAALRQRLTEASGARLGRSLNIRHVSAGSCGGCEMELRATRNLAYDLSQYGISFTQSPRHADILLITGVANRNMREAIRQTREAMAEPVFVVAVGDCALDGGVFKGAPAVSGGADSILPVDLAIPGCPPSPRQIVEGLLALLEAQAPAKKLPARAKRN